MRVKLQKPFYVRGRGMIEAGICEDWPDDEKLPKTATNLDEDEETTTEGEKPKASKPKATTLKEITPDPVKEV